MFFVNIAEFKIKINNHYPFSEKFCKNYIINSCDFDFEINVSEKEILDEQNSSETIFPLDYCESIVIYRKIAQNLYKYNAFVLHSVAISVDGNGYLFLAKSGVGKSTHISLYEKHFKERFKIINGDKPIIRFMNNKFYAYGTPYNGKENLGCKERVEIKGLCFIKRGSKNIAYSIDINKASILMFNQILLPDNQKDYDTLLNLIEILLSKVKLVEVQCTISPDAVKASYEALGGKYEN